MFPLDVKSIIQLWHKELAEDAEHFRHHAQRVGTWDSQLRANQKTLEGTIRFLCASMYLHLLYDNGDSNILLFSFFFGSRIFI